VERLGKRPIDLLQLHNPPLQALQDPALYRLAEELKEAGLVTAFGVALGPETEVLEQAGEALSHPQVQVVQFVYNLLEQEPGRLIGERARERGVGVLVRVPHAGGVLSGRLSRGGSRRLRDHRALRRAEWYEWAFDLYREMEPVLSRLPGTPAQQALRFILDSISVSSVVLITREVEELREFIEGLSLPRLSPQTVARLVTLYSRGVRRLSGCVAHDLEGRA
jgi:aryl-alcohol dehydrogenase-like predicted oxidoreductase